MTFEKSNNSKNVNILYYARLGSTAGLQSLLPRYTVLHCSLCMDTEAVVSCQPGNISKPGVPHTSSSSGRPGSVHQFDLSPALGAGAEQTISVLRYK